MDSRAPSASLTAFKELPLDLEPTVGGGIIHIQLPSTGAFGRTSRLTRRVLRGYPKTKSQEEYGKWHVAISSGVLFRKEDKYPRSILWRSLEGNVLELRSVDLVRGEAENKEAGVIFQIAFSHGIRPGCVGLSDADHGDSFHVFVLTKNNDLYSFQLRSSFLYRPEASEEELERWCQTSRPSVLSLSQPYKLTHCSPNEIVFALGDGRLVHLTRPSGGDGRSWTESVFADGNWGPSLRGLIRWQGQNTIRYDGMNLDPNTSIAARPTPDGKHMVTATLNHTLKMWSVETKKPTLTRDLLNIERDPSQVGKVLLDPGLNQVLALESDIRVAYSGDKYYLFTFTPHEGGSFKIWGVRDADFGGDGVRDLFPEEVLRVPDPDDGALWTVSDFKISGNPSTDEVSVWIMLRLNRRYLLFHKKFSGLGSLAQEWNDDWEQTSMATASAPRPEDADDIQSEPLGLALDARTELPWILLTNAVSPVRSCTETESLVLNSLALSQGQNTVAQSIESGSSSVHSDAAVIIDAASHLRAGFEDELLDDAIRAELWQDPSLSARERIFGLYERAGMGTITDRYYIELLAALQAIGGLDSLTTEGFFSILQTFPEQLSQPTKLESTAFGRKALVAGAAEVISLHERIVSDLLCALVFLDQEIDREEHGMPELNIPRVFEELVEQLRTIQVIRWISSTTNEKDDRPITILEDLFASDIRPQSPAHRPGSLALTESIRDLVKWSSGGNVADTAVHIQCSLLANQDLHLATAFLRYQPSTAWATYIRARYNLLCHDYVSAAVHFKKAAFVLSRKEPPSSFYSTASGKFLTSLEAGYLASGLGRYYAHVANLFSVPQTTAHSQTVQFASLALQHLSHDIGAHTTHSEQSLRSDMLARLFHSSIALDDYEGAFVALVRYTDNALRRAALKELVTAMLNAGAASELVALPFTGPLRPEVDALLTDMVRREAEAGNRASSGFKAVKVLYAWKVQQGDYRGAAACIIEKLRIQPGGKSSRKRRHARMAADKEGVMDDYLIAINALSLLGGEPGVEGEENEGWVFMETGDPEKSRSLVRLRDLRREYQEEMDVREKWERGRFALTAGDSDEDDGDVMEI